MEPFLKWPGGKRWFVDDHSAILPRAFTRYIEPFLGGGSVFFHLQPERALLSDSNRELIETYKGVRDDWMGLKRRLSSYQRRHNEKLYYRIREADPDDLVDRAARMIYLNRTCFNGIYRVNRKGQFNVPKGTRDSVVFATDDFESAARLLQRADLRVADFEVVINAAASGDLIFADPPYTVRHNLNGFIKYNQTLFSWDDQVRLADALGRARDRGAKIVSTNANHHSVRKLYRDRNFKLKTVSRFSGISADPKSRKPFEELVILAT